jgi:hypothetical protein
MPKKELVSPKLFAKKYGISVLKDGKQKSIHQLTTDIYNYERSNKVNKGLFPFLKIK